MGISIIQAFLFSTDNVGKCEKCYIVTNIEHGYIHNIQTIALKFIANIMTQMLASVVSKSLTGGNFRKLYK